MQEDFLSLSGDGFSEMDPETPFSESVYSSSEVSSTSGEKPYLRFDHHTLRRAFQRVFVKLTENIIVEDYLDHLVQREVINLGVMDGIRSKGSAQDMARELLIRVWKRDEGCEVMMELFQHRDICQRHLYVTVFKEYKSLKMQSSELTEKSGHSFKGITQNDVSYGKYAEFVVEVVQSQTIEGGGGSISNGCQLVRCSLTQSDNLASRVVQELNCLIVEDGCNEEEYVRLITMTLTPVNSVKAESDFEWVELSNLMTEVCVDDQSGVQLKCYIRKINFWPFISASHRTNVIDSLSLEEHQSDNQGSFTTLFRNSNERKKAGLESQLESVHLMDPARNSLSNQEVTCCASNETTLEQDRSRRRGYQVDSETELRRQPESADEDTPPSFPSQKRQSEYFDEGTPPSLTPRRRQYESPVAGAPPSLPSRRQQSESPDANALPSFPSQKRQSESPDANAPPSLPSQKRQSESPDANAPPSLPSQKRQSESPDANAPLSLPSQRRQSKSPDSNALPSLPSQRRQSGSPDANVPPSIPSQRRQSESMNNAEAPKDLLALLRKVPLGVGKEKIKSSKVMNDVTRKIVNILQTEHELVLRPLYAGSSFEGAKIESADEYDVLLMLDGKELDPTRQHPQFASLHPRNPDNYKFKEYLDSDGFLDPEKVISQIFGWTQLAANKLFPKGHEYQVTISKNGPAVKLSIKSERKSDFGKIDVDLVPAFEVLNDNYVAKSCKTDVEAKAIKGRVPQKEVLWRKSFSLLEKQRLSKIDKDGGCRRQCLRLLKFFRLRESTLKGLDSYHYKILLLNECQRLPQTSETWAANQLAERFWGLLNQLSLYLEQRKLPHCIDGDINVFENIKDSAMENMRTRLKSIIKKGVPEIEKILNRDPI
ncbi:uncharacterized protein LOC135468665 [Liolophura sinensis]|uniref:uncharacterized protein LOC135468665 n=1 Tax=Liolophura sinensis TaxID=3198878 RepID=UPI0031597FEE